VSGEIILNHIYRAKRPRAVGVILELFDDRQVIHVTETRVQYDSPTVPRGRKFPTVDRAKFEAWVGQDVTAGYPKGDWAEWTDA